MKNISPQDRLLAVIRPLVAEKRRELEHLKRSHRELKRPDFVWHYLLQSFATMGKASGWNGLIGNPENYKRVKYESLEALPPIIRKRQVYETCRAAKLRMPDKKASYILECFEQVKRMGGQQTAKELLFGQPDADSKIRFLKGFRGIGPKYARNMMMDVYHKEFRDRIAIDVRIKSISDALGISFRDSEYADHEAFYLEVAHRASLNGWELDRLLFRYRNEILDLLGEHKRNRVRFALPVAASHDGKATAKLAPKKRNPGRG